MIQLKPDCLIFKTSDGDSVPCSAEWVTLELMGDGACLIDAEVVRNASAAVLHYFKDELNRDFVSVGEFALALERVLRGFGVSVFADANADAPIEQKRIVETNLRELVNSTSKGFELVFFPHLRQELKSKLELSPQVLRFHGLRDCVKELEGAARWTRRCQNLNDQIVEYLRSCLETERPRHPCALMVS